MGGSPATLRGGETGVAGALHREEARAGTCGTRRQAAVWQRSSMWCNRGTGRLTSGPGHCIVPILIFFNYFSNRFVLIPSNGCLPCTKFSK
jgi:hypothetical protein